MAGGLSRHVAGRTAGLRRAAYSAGMRHFNTLDELAACVGQDVACSEWHRITQEQVDRFAQATGDLQWIHTDPVRASQGPFGGTIAHGFLTLSLMPWFLEHAFDVAEVRMGVNCGLNRVRFTAPVPVGGRLRAHFRLSACDAVDRGGRQLTWAVTVELEGCDKPACVAEFLARLYP